MLFAPETKTKQKVNFRSKPLLPSCPRTHLPQRVPKLAISRGPDRWPGPSPLTKGRSTRKDGLEEMNSSRQHLLSLEVWPIPEALRYKGRRVPECSRRTASLTKTTRGQGARARPHATPRQLSAWSFASWIEVPAKTALASPQRRTRRGRVQQHQQEPPTPGQAAGAWNKIGRAHV